MKSIYLKKILKSPIILKPLYIFLRLFYEKKYITGKYFGEFSYEGYKWALKSIPARIFMGYPWPCSLKNEYGDPKCIFIDSSSLQSFQRRGCYFQAWGDRKINIKKNCYIANNVQIVTRNHDVYNLDQHTEGGDVIINDNCWIASNVVILPGVILGEHTVVAANAVVNKSFPEGYVILGGIPAKIIKKIGTKQ